MKRYVYMLVVLILSATLSGCGTIRGFGDDLSALGRGIAKVSDNVRENVTGQNK